MKNSIAVRLAVMFGLAACGVFVVLAVALHHVLVFELDRHQREQLESRSQDMQYMLMHDRSPMAWHRVREKLDALSPQNGRTRYWIWSDDPAYRYGQDVDRLQGLGSDDGEIVEVPLGPDGDPMKVLSRDIPAHNARPEVRFMVGIDARPFRQTLRAFESALAALLVGSIGAVGSLGYWIARLGLRPVERLARDAQRISPSNRAQRLQLPALPRELSELGAAFNAALDRLDAAYHQLEVFNADVAHELRTPLTNLIGQTQVTLARERTADHLHGVLASNLEELERLRGIVADMLFLARADQGAKAVRRQSSSIAAEVGKTVEFLDLLLEEAGMTVKVIGDETAPIETSLFRRALANLLQNAIEHSRRGGEITVRICRRPGAAEVAFTNASDPIAPAQIDRLFDRFYRVDASRTGSDGNHGLGLSIVKAVALMHQGDVFAACENGLTTVGFSVRAEEAAPSVDLAPPGPDGSAVASHG